MGRRGVDSEVVRARGSRTSIKLLFFQICWRSGKSNEGSGKVRETVQEGVGRLGYGGG